MDLTPLKLSVNAKIETIDMKTGEIKQTSRVHNTVVNEGLNRIRDLIGGFSATPFGYIGIGTSNTAVTNSDTSLGAETHRQLATITQGGTGVVQYVYTFSFGSSFTIVEAGLFDLSSAGGDTMLNRLVFSGHAVDGSNGLKVTITVTCARP